MERIKELNRYQKGILLLLAAMILVFGVIYSSVSSRVGFLYNDAILVPSEENGNTIYSGTIQGEKCSFAVTPDKTVTFRWGEKEYGPYTVKADSSAVPDEHPYLTGVEILEGDDILFRGGYFVNGADKSNLVLIDENGDFAGFTISAVMSDGTVIDGEGNVVDQMAPSASVVLQLTLGPELTSKGQWPAWFLGVFISVITALSILFADELFRFNLAFRIQNVDRAEPSEWELGSRYIGWTVLTVMAFVIYIMGLQ